MYYQAETAYVNASFPLIEFTGLNMVLEFKTT